MVGNKDDLYSEEEVSYEEGLELSKEINAIYQRTSAKNGTGIEDSINQLVNNYVNNYIFCNKNENTSKGVELQNKKETKNSGCC